MMAAILDPRSAFINAACVPLDEGHGSGSLEQAESILAAYPDVASSDIHTAAILGDDAAVKRFLRIDPRGATAKARPRGWDPLTYLCFSRYLRLDGSRSDGFVRAAEALLDAGASAGTGWMETRHQPCPEWESAIYGAAGVARHPALTRLLLERGADPNDNETPYHAPETWDNSALKVLVESGTLTDDSLATMLIRKADWHDHEGIEYLLEHGANPNRMPHWGVSALHQALRRDNALESIESMLNHGADATLRSRRDGRSAVAIAARRGRGDVLALFDRRGVRMALEGVERLIAACARGDGAAVRSIAAREPRLVRELLADGPTLLVQFAGTANTAGVECLLQLGVDVNSAFVEGDDYFGIAKNSTALHVAAWGGWPTTVKYLIGSGASVNARESAGRTPLMLAVRACVDSYWTSRRTPESVEALLRAGASVDGVLFPSGYAEADALIEQYRKPRSGDLP